MESIQDTPTKAAAAKFAKRSKQKEGSNWAADSDADWEANANCDWLMTDDKKKTEKAERTEIEMQIKSEQTK